MLGKRKRRRPLSIHTPLHLVMRSDFAYGNRSLLRHRPLIDRIIKKAGKKFSIKIYEKAVVSNHIHLLIRGYKRESIQNFFRVVAGHIAQEILKEWPLSKQEVYRRGSAPAKKREQKNKFWETRIYSRVMKWGAEFFRVKAYVVKNTLEALGLIQYKKRISYKETG